MFHMKFQIGMPKLKQISFFLIRYSEVSLREPVEIDEKSLERAIQQANRDVDTTNECNENVRKMISTLLYV